jgi:hypothetical protein
MPLNVKEPATIAPMMVSALTGDTSEVNVTNLVSAIARYVVTASAYLNASSLLNPSLTFSRSILVCLLHVSA